MPKFTRLALWISPVVGFGIAALLLANSNSMESAAFVGALWFAAVVGLAMVPILWRFLLNRVAELSDAIRGRRH